MEFWQNLEKNATQIMIVLPHYMWAENNNPLIYIDSQLKVAEKTCVEIGSFLYDFS